MLEELRQLFEDELEGEEGPGALDRVEDPHWAMGVGGARPPLGPHHPMGVAIGLGLWLCDLAVEIQSLPHLLEFRCKGSPDFEASFAFVDHGNDR